MINVSLIVRNYKFMLWGGGVLLLVVNENKLRIDDVSYY